MHTQLLGRYLGLINITQINKNYKIYDSPNKLMFPFKIYFIPNYQYFF